MHRALLALALSLLLLGCPGEPEEDSFHDRTKLPRPGIVKSPAPRKGTPEGEKNHPERPSISLPGADYRGMPVEETIRKRRSTRSYSGKPMELEELSTILFSAQGITGELYGTKLRAAPSAGALYPIELYAVVHNVRGIAPGLYHYNPFEHSLTQLREGDLRNEICNAGLTQEALRNANVVLALTAIPERTTRKYGERGHRYIYMEAGHIAENALLEAVSLGLGAVPIGAFFDDGLNELLGIDGKQEISLYLVAVGKI
jgi:SagB-type dehydrogenase family enzyme